MKTSLAYGSLMGASYAVFLQGTRAYWFPGFIWPTVVGGACLVALVLWGLLPAVTRRREVIRLLVLAHIAVGAPIIVWCLLFPA